jgi:hypothetical protein
MALPRSPFAGDTNYFGATIQDLVAHLNDWRKMTQETIDELNKLRADVVEKQDRLDEPVGVLDFIDYMVNQFQRFINDFDRIIRELPSSVEERHVELIRRLAQRGQTLDQSCVQFKQDYIRRPLKDERLRPLIDTVYSEARSMTIDYADLFNLLGQLKTFVGTRVESQQLSIDDVDVLELKPNVFGLGVNLNHLVKRFGRWWKKKNETGAT